MPESGNVRDDGVPPLYLLPTCDTPFGPGRYLTNARGEAVTLASLEADPVLETVTLEPAGLTYAHVSDPAKWALFVAANRGLLDAGTTRAVLARYESADVVVGPAYDETTSPVFKSYLAGELTDEGLRAELESLQPPTRYVLKTARATDALVSLGSERL